MAVSVGYVSREATSNLWRNRMMTVAAVLTVAVSLALVGSALLLKQGAAHATERWQQGVNVVVFVDAGASHSEFTAVGRQLDQLPYVKSCIARSQEWDYNEARSIEPAEVFQALTPAITPSSWRCALSQPSEASLIVQQFSGKPGIQHVASPSAQIRTMETVIHVLQWAFLIVAGILLLSASVLILNTIRMAIFARRREVAVMKLVGATNWFIRLPFMAEGLVQGLLGSLVAVLVVLGLYFGFLDQTKTAANQSSLIVQMSLGGTEVAVTCIVVLVVGVLAGVIGSALAVRRFLDV